MKILKTIFAGLLLCALARPAYAENPSEKILFGALQTEMGRSLARLTFEDFKPPYFLSYQILDSTDSTFNSRFGDVLQDQVSHNRYLYVELRYGSYDSDNTDENARGVFDTIPLENDVSDIRHRFWLATDQTYKQAIKDYLQKQGKKVSEIEKEKLPDFSKGEPHQAEVEIPAAPADLEAYKSTIKQASGEFKRYEKILDSGVTLRAGWKTVYYLNSEGSRIVMPASGNTYFVYVWARAQSDDGMGLEVYRTFSVRTADRLPSATDLQKTISEISRQLLELRDCKIGDPLTAPAILDPESTGVLFHEALGHRVEGERQRNPDEGQTFKGSIGKEVIPSFLSVDDDPTAREWRGQALNGYYAFDDEGSPAQKVRIVENGVLKNFLMSRRPISGFPQSNGHGRSQFGRDPIGRMSNLFVKSTREVSGKTLKKMLLEECKKQNKSFGFLIKRTRSGDTSTARGHYQAFRGTPEEVYLVDAKTGNETLIRGVELVGTPLITINKILATSDAYEVSNAYCGAESGSIPVATIAPSSLVKEVELQREREEKLRPPILPPPLFDKGAK